MATDMTVANEIVRQIGNRAFQMMGTSHKVGTEDSLRFDIRGSKKWKWVRIKLEPDDTYTVTFIRQKRGNLETEEKSFADVYVDNLHDLIEEETGLYLRL